MLEGFYFPRGHKCYSVNAICVNMFKNRIDKYLVKAGWVTHRIVLGGCPFNGPLSGTKYPTRAASSIQNASTPKSVTVFKTSQLCAVVRCCAKVLVEHCTEFRTSFISRA